MSRVLVVDDEPLVLMLLKRVLTEAGYDLLEAASGEEALAILDQSGVKVDVLLTDLKMPQMTGQQLAARVRRDRPDIRVIYMSGFCDLAAAGVDALAGSSAFLQKPFNRNSLLAAMMSVGQGIPATHVSQTVNL